MRDNNNDMNTHNALNRDMREQLLMIAMVFVLVIGFSSGFTIGSTLSAKRISYDKNISGVYTMINSNNNVIYTGAE